MRDAEDPKPEKENFSKQPKNSTEKISNTFGDYLSVFDKNKK